MIGSNDIESMMFLDLNKYSEEDGEIIEYALEKQEFNLEKMSTDLNREVYCRYVELLNAYDSKIIHEDTVKYIASLN